MLNPNGRMKEQWTAAYNAHCPARVKQYIEAYGEEFKEYLDKRGYENTM